jgi:hypothetical protein
MPIVEYDPKDAPGSDRSHGRGVQPGLAGPCPGEDGCPECPALPVQPRCAHMQSQILVPGHTRLRRPVRLHRNPPRCHPRRQRRANPRPRSRAARTPGTTVTSTGSSGWACTVSGPLLPQSRWGSNSDAEQTSGAPASASSAGRGVRRTLGLRAAQTEHGAATGGRGPWAVGRGPWANGDHALSFDRRSPIATQMSVGFPARVS